MNGVTKTPNAANAKFSDLAALFEKSEFIALERLARAYLTKALANKNAATRTANDDEKIALYWLAQAVGHQKTPAKFDEAIGLMEKLLAADPLNAAYHNDYGALFAAHAAWDKAEAAYKMAMIIDPSHNDAAFNLALSIFKQERYEEALAILAVLEGKIPLFGEIFALRGEIFHAQKRAEEAVDAFQKALALGLETTELIIWLGVSLANCERHEEAKSVFQQAEKTDPKANFHLGRYARQAHDLNTAERYYRQAILLQADFAVAWNNLGLVRHEREDFIGAAAALTHALQLDPLLGEAHNNYGNLLVQQGNSSEALAHFESALEITPDSALSLSNLGVNYRMLGYFDRAEAAFQKSLTIDPKCDSAAFNLGILYLLQGNYAEGWPLYEKRLVLTAAKEAKNTASTKESTKEPAPRWCGESLENKALLVYSEQGLGDNIQFVRYFSLLRERYPTTRFYFQCLPALFRLCEASLASLAITLLPQDMPEGLPPFDYRIPLLSLPFACGTSLVPSPTIPYLYPPEFLIKTWGEKLAPRLRPSAKKRIGLVWRGSNISIFLKARSIAFARLAPLFALDGIDWISLQQRKPDDAPLNEAFAPQLIDLMDEVSDFADTAALMAHCGLVIGIDTSVTHLAGAMGIPTYLFCRCDADWRWLLERSDSPWYPSLRIFRQPSLGDWDGAIADVAQALSAFLTSEPS